MYTNRNPPLNKRLKESDAGVGVLSHCCPVRALYRHSLGPMPTSLWVFDQVRTPSSQRRLETAKHSSRCHIRSIKYLQSPLLWIIPSIYNGWSSHKRGLFHSLNWFFFRMVRKMSRGCDSAALYVYTFLLLFFAIPLFGTRRYRPIYIQLLV